MSLYLELRDRINNILFPKVISLLSEIERNHVFISFNRHFIFQEDDGEIGYDSPEVTFQQFHPLVNYENNNFLFIRRNNTLNWVGLTGEPNVASRLDFDNEKLICNIKNIDKLKIKNNIILDLSNCLIKLIEQLERERNKNLLNF